MNREKDISTKVNKDLVARSFNGTWSQPFSFAIILLTTNCVSRMPAFAWGAAAALSTITILRLFLLLRFDEMYAARPRAWRSFATTLLMLSALFWGVTASVATYYFKPASVDTLIFLIAHSAMGIGMVNLLVHDLRQMNLALGFLYIPILVVEFGDAGLWHGPGLVTLAYLCYLIFQGKRLSQAYWQQVNDNYDLATLARRDFLTGLPNRLGMQEILSSAVMDARHGGRLVALLYVDLDGFKEVNDRYSHRTGDLLLREVARRLGNGVQPAGVAARLGGDEFAILIRDCSSPQEASTIAEYVLQAAKDPVRIDDQLVTCSASIGISFFPHDADSPDHLVRTADKAMYIAKKAGKNRVCLFEDRERIAIQATA